MLDSSIEKHNEIDIQINACFQNYSLMLNEYLELLLNTYNVVYNDTLGVDSIVLTYYSNSKLYQKIPYMNGVVHGIYERFWPGGQLDFRHIHIKGSKADGIFVSFNIKGEISQTGRIRNGVQVGFWYHNGYLGMPFIMRKYSRKGVLQKKYYWIPEKKRWVDANKVAFKKRFNK